MYPNSGSQDRRTDSGFYRQRMSATSDAPEKTDAANTKLGCVKWFNNKVGYGFLTYENAAGTSEDVFVHHSAISVKSEQYRYLMQGEYVQFELIESQSKQYNMHASNVRGVNGGNLMCETRNQMRSTWTPDSHHKSKHNEENFKIAQKGKQTRH